MKRLTACFVALARSASHEANLLHKLGDSEEEEHARQLARHYMDSAKRFKANQQRSMPA